jgi:undecaprenyl-diphosphatase
MCFLVTAIFKDSFYAVNLDVNVWAASVNSGAFTLTAKVISIVFDTTVMLALCLVVAFSLFILHRKRYSVLLLGAMAGDALLVQTLKTVIMSPRPPNEIIFQTGFSLPSGHTTASVVFFGVLTYFAWMNWKSRKVKVLTSGCYFFVVALVGFDRIYLNVHWFSDIVGGVFLGAFWLSFCIFTFKYAISNGRGQHFLRKGSKTVSQRCSPPFQSA